MKNCKLHEIPDLSVDPQIIMMVDMCPELQALVDKAEIICKQSLEEVEEDYDPDTSECCCFNDVVVQRRFNSYLKDLHGLAKSYLDPGRNYNVSQILYKDCAEPWVRRDRLLRFLEDVACYRFWRYAD